MNSRTIRMGAILGAAAVSALAVSPAFAAGPVSQSTARSLQLSIGGNSVIAQETTATNDGTTETVTDNSTVPTLADLLPANNLIGAGVAPQAAVAKPDGTSFACAGIAGTGGGIVTVGDSACELNGQPLTLDLASLDLGNIILGSESALGSALSGPLGPLLDPLGIALTQVVTALSDGLADTPLGEITIGGSLSAIEASCVADPDSAEGDTRLVDSSGGENATPISVTLPGVAEPVILLNLPANPPEDTEVVVELDQVTQTLIDGLEVELATAVTGALSGLGLGAALQAVQDQVVVVLVANLQPLLQAVQENLLRITLNQQTSGDGGRSIEVTALELEVLPAAAQFAGSALVSGRIGHVTCGPNSARVVEEPPTDVPPPTPDNPEDASPPTVVNAGATGTDSSATATLAATAALLTLAGTAGLIGYRRKLMS